MLKLTCRLGLMNLHRLHHITRTANALLLSLITPLLMVRQSRYNLKTTMHECGNRGYNKTTGKQRLAIIISTHS